MTNARQEDRSIRCRTGLAAFAALALVPLTACGTGGHATTASAKVSTAVTPAAERTDQAFQSLECALQAALRRIGDVTTHVDRTEPTLNTAVPGDVRDTTTPQQMGLDLQKYTLGHLLPKPKRAMLVDWMRRNTTGGALIRAGFPADWAIGDKTGSGDYGTRNDVAVAWPPRRAPIVIAIFTTRSTKDAKTDDALVAAAAKVVAGRLT